jgi:hypothetical protein
MIATYRVRGWSLDAWGFQGQTDAPRWSFRHDVTRLRRRPHARGRTGNRALRSGSESGSGSFARPGPSHGRLPAGWLLLACRVLYAVFGCNPRFLDRPSSVSGLPVVVASRDLWSASYARRKAWDLVRVRRHLPCF